MNWNRINWGWVHVHHVIDDESSGIIRQATVTAHHPSIHQSRSAKPAAAATSTSYYAWFHTTNLAKVTDAVMAIVVHLKLGASLWWQQCRRRSLPPLRTQPTTTPKKFFTCVRTPGWVMSTNQQDCWAARCWWRRHAIAAATTATGRNKEQHCV